jgi:hypothetical protein
MFTTAVPPAHEVAIVAVPRAIEFKVPVKLYPLPLKSSELKLVPAVILLLIALFEPLAGNTKSLFAGGGPAGLQFEPLFHVLSAAPVHV